MKSNVEEAFKRLLAAPGVVFLLGGIDTGKTTFGIELLRRAIEQEIKCAIVDADIAQSSVGPPTTVGMKVLSDASALERAALRTPDSMGFVGSLSPRGHRLPLATTTGKLVGRARREGCSLVVVDTTAFVAGIDGQLLKFFKMDLVDPDFVVALERGGELEPIVGIAQRFTRAEVLELDVSPEVPTRSAEERVAFREEQFAAYFATGTSRWRVKPTVFLPTVPSEFDLGLLEGLVVGMEDGSGTCVGVGVLEYDAGEDILRMVSPVTEGVKGLRLGSIRIDLDGRSRGPIDLHNLFGTE